VAVAVLAARRFRHWVVVGGLVAVVLLIGSATMGSAAVSYRISHRRIRSDSLRTGSSCSAKPLQHWRRR
jgi:hypothetical protein